MTESALRIQGATKAFGSVVAVNQVELSIQPGEFFSLLGPSGCGKTTTLRLIAGLEKLDQGDIFIGRRNISNLPPERRNLGMVFQNYALFPHMNVYENLAYGLKLRRQSRAEIDTKVERTLHQVGMPGVQARLPHQLSGGQQQRIALARALIIEPEVLLLDEPLSNLDRKLREQMQIWVKHLQQEMAITTIYVTHDQTEALTMSDRIAVMNGGIVEQVGSPREIYDQPANRFVSSFIGETNTIEATARLDNGLSGEAAGLRINCGDDVGGINDGDSLLIIVRPESIALAAAQAALDTVNRFTGEVLECVYRGPHVKYFVRLGDGLDIQILHQGKDAAEHARGDRVAVGWNPAQSIHFLPGGGAQS